MPEYRRQCPICHTMFTARRSDRITCSSACRIRKSRYGVSGGRAQHLKYAKRNESANPQEPSRRAVKPRIRGKAAVVRPAADTPIFDRSEPTVTAWEDRIDTTSRHTHETRWYDDQADRFFYGRSITGTLDPEKAAKLAMSDVPGAQEEMERLKTASRADAIAVASTVGVIFDARTCAYKIRIKIVIHRGDNVTPGFVDLPLRFPEAKALVDQGVTLTRQTTPGSWL